MIEQLATHIHAGKIGPVIYAVPRHKLGEKIRQQFLDHGIDARIFRGRNADDPDFNPGKPMCLNLPAVELALRCHADVSKTCCYKNRKTRCEFFDSAATSARCRRRVTSRRFGSSPAICCFTNRPFSASRTS